MVHGQQRRLCDAAVAVFAAACVHLHAHHAHRHDVRLEPAHRGGGWVLPAFIHELYTCKNMGKFLYCFGALKILPKLTKKSANFCMHQINILVHTLFLINIILTLSCMVLFACFYY